MPDKVEFSDQELIKMFTTYWGYLMFMNKKQGVSNVNVFPGITGMFSQIISSTNTNNQKAEDKHEPKFKHLKKRESKALTKM